MNINIARISRLSHKLNVLDFLLRVSPLKIFFISLIVGIALSIWSYFIGCGWFNLEGSIAFIDTTTPQMPGVFPLGFIQQFNYGPWYLFLCPFVYLFASLAAQTSDSSVSYFKHDDRSLLQISQKPLFGFLGSGLFLFFVCCLALVELNDYKKLALGWVQAIELANLQEQMQNDPMKQPEILIPNKKFFPLVKNKKSTDDENDCQFKEANKIIVKKITPFNFSIRSKLEFIVFVICAKIWAALWQAVVIYLGFLVIPWSVYIFNCHIRSKDIKYIQFANNSIYLILCVGILVNIFFILRFWANSYKGTYGNWDQYLSLVNVLPATTILFLDFSNCVHMYRLNKSDKQTFFTKERIVLWTFWFSSISYFMYLLLIYFDNSSASVINFRPKPPSL